MAHGLTLLTSPEDAEESCYIETPRGVASVLNAVILSASRAAAYFHEGRSFIHTSLLAVEDDATLLFEKGPDPLQNTQLAGAPEITIVSSDHGVPVQFTCGRALTVNHEGVEVFRVSLPARVLRLQRRGYFRLAGDPVLSVKCEVHRGDAAENKLLKPSLLDLSCGGFAGAIPVAEPPLESGSTHRCTLEFPGLGKVEAWVAVHGSREVTLPGGVAAKCYGLELRGLDAKKTGLVQRYIHEQERKKKKML